MRTYLRLPLVLAGLLALSSPGCRDKKKERAASVSDPQPSPAPTPAIDAGAADAREPLPALEAWELGPGQGPELTLRMRDLDARFLMWTLRPPTSVLALSRPGTLLSGHARGSSEAFLEALQERVPDLRFASSPAIRGKGRQIDLQYYGANTRDLLQLLAEVGGINIVVRAEELPALDISLRAAPWDGVLQSLATLLDLRIESQGPTYFLLGPGESLVKTAAPGKEKLDLRIKGSAPLGALVELIAAVSPTKLTSDACDAELSELRLRRVDSQQLIRALALKSGEEIQLGESACPSLPRLRPEDLDAYQLVAAVHGTAVGGLFARGDQWGLLVTEGARLSASMYSLMLPGEEISFRFYPPAEEEWSKDYDELSPRGLLTLGDTHILLAQDGDMLTAIRPSELEGELSLEREGS